MSGAQDLALTLAINDYDHVRDVVEGRVPVDGVTLTTLTLSVEEIFYRFSRYREWHVTELSLAKFVALRSQGEPIVAIPVFPSRQFRHSAIFVRADASILDPAQLAGARIGIPEWSQTAGIYVRALLEHQYGVALDGVHWFQGGVNEPGRIEGIELAVPEGIRLTPVSDRTLSEMLIAGELDAIVSAHPPETFKQGDGEIRRLIENPREVEERYYLETGIHPIMHTIAIRGDVYDEHPWVAMSLMKAFDEAKRRSLERLIETNTSRIPLPWGSRAAERSKEIFGEDFWPYGIEPNRPTLEAFLQYSFEQGLTTEETRPEDLFVPEVQTTYRI
ncbi:MAG TPA: hypothetical protein VFB41_04290 [Solirubrobacteraceae bacterium]|nr:hypothetical protein [Solirubrobacteraceae bacterium]